MNKTSDGRFDFIASGLVPGWTQAMYFAPKSAGMFFIGAICAWIWFPWRVAAGVHLVAMLHGAVLVRLSISGKRPATPEAWRAKSGIGGYQRQQ